MGPCCQTFFLYLADQSRWDRHRFRPLAERPGTANALVRMLEVTTRRGTSRKAFASRQGRPSYRAAGKTGTLNVRRPSRMLSWFAGFAPSRKPEVVVAVMLANDISWCSISTLTSP